MTTPAPLSLSASHQLIQNLQQQLQHATGAPVQLLQTHISWILLTREHAYKFKKPVQLPFADFSTLALRKHFCQEELRLNKRMAPDLYEGIVAITGTPEEPQLQACPPATDSNVLDYGVCMHRFATSALAQNRLSANLLGTADMHDLACRVAQLHAHAATNTPDPSYGSPQQIQDAVKQVLQTLANMPEAARSYPIAAWQNWIQEQAQTLRTTWQQRQAQGFVREGHGDLHLGNIVSLPQGTTAFDCIEFQPAFRWLDVINDVPFQTMDLRANGRPDQAAHFLNAYLQACGDYAAVRVLRFYEVYRALVRLMVAHLSPPQTDHLPGPDYAGCAQELITNAPHARLLITCGLSGSGKSTVARELTHKTGAICIRSDVERKRIFGLPAHASSQAHGLDIYTTEATNQTFNRLHDLAQNLLQAGQIVIVDAVFMHQQQRERFAQLASSMNVPFQILYCQASDALLQERIAQRQHSNQDASEADLHVLAMQQPLFTAPAGSELACTTTLDTSDPASVSSQLDTLVMQWAHTHG